MTATIEAVTPTTVTKFHFSLWVADLDKTVAFYRILFGQEPHKHYRDYAKFELAEPPVVVSFLPQPAPRGASLNHVGLRLPDSAGLVEVQRRLERAGYSTIREDGVECCYSRQTKFWATDPDGVRWEMYTMHEDIDHHGKTRQPTPAPVARIETVPANDTWTHTLPDPFPDRLPFADASLDEVRLMGTFNGEDGLAGLRKALAETTRVLRPGGRVLVRGLTGDRTYPGRPDFPGLLSKLRFIPTEKEPLETLVKAGFHAAEIETWKDAGCIKDGSGVAFRSVILSARKIADDNRLSPPVRYDGPFAKLTDDDGNIFVRGVPVRIAAGSLERLRASKAASQFTFLES